MELRKCFGKSGIVYHVFDSPNERWKAFKETPTGYVNVEAKSAAIDCGAVGERDVLKTYDFWKQIWKD